MRLKAHKMTFIKTHNGSGNLLSSDVYLNKKNRVAGCRRVVSETAFDNHISNINYRIKDMGKFPKIVYLNALSHFIGIKPHLVSYTLTLNTFSASFFLLIVVEIQVTSRLVRSATT